MERMEPKGTPMLAGWAIGAAAGLVAFGVAFVQVGIGANGAVFIGAVIALVVGVMLGLPGAAATPPVAVASVPTTATLPVASAPVTPAPLMSAPASPPPVAAEPVAARRPAALAGARDGGPDDLKRIKGIGPKLELLCHSLGFYHFDQLAAWTPDEIAWVDENLEGFKGRVTRDEWVAQAKLLAAGDEATFARLYGNGEGT